MRRELSLWLMLAMLLGGFASPVCAADPDAVAPLASYVYLDTLADPPSQPNVVSPLVSYLYQDSPATPPDQPNVVSPLVSYLYHDSLATPPDQPNVVSPLVSYLFYDWPGDENLTFQNSPLVSYFFPIEGGSPFFVAQPHSQFVQAGSAATFGVLADGQPTLNYQWRFNGQNISGATSSTLTLNSVTAANSGGYSVVVSNPNGSITSATASIAVLTDGADGNQPQQPVYPTLPPAEVGKDSLVFITHGKTPYGDPGEHRWLDDMKAAIKAQVPANWMVIRYKWVEQSRDPFGTWVGDLAGAMSVLGEARKAGRIAGEGIIEIAQLTPNNRWEHVHLIGHSAGARLIEEASRIIANKSPTTTIHTTFLDADTGLTGRSEYGSASDWADSYFAQDWTAKLTEGPLDNAYSADVTWVDPNKEISPIYCSGGSPLFDQVCGQRATSSHEYPYDFYLASIFATNPACASGYGFAMSKEGGGWNNRGSYPVGNAPQNLCGSQPTIQNPSLFRFNPTLQIGLLSSASSGSGVSMSADSFALTSTLTAPARRSNTKQDGPIIQNGGPTPEASGEPVWLAVGVTVTNAVNFVSFDATFSNTNAAEGLMTVYWNTNEIGTVDERVGKPIVETYRFGLPGIVTNGLYTLSFRLDVFTNASSTITVTNVTTGFAGLDQPITLAMLMGSNNVPVLKLTGKSNFTYLVESSTNLLNWSPSALLPTTNGTALFADPSATNSSQRFYRATLP